MCFAVMPGRWGPRLRRRLAVDDGDGERGRKRASEAAATETAELKSGVGLFNRMPVITSGPVSRGTCLKPSASSGGAARSSGGESSPAPAIYACWESMPLLRPHSDSIVAPDDCN